MSPAQTRERESKRALPTALATFLAVVLMIAAAFVSNASGTGNAEFLRSVDAHSGSVVISALMRALAFALLAVPLVYLFRAVRARSERVRPQLIGLVVIAPLFLAVSTGLAGFAQKEAAGEFVAGEAKSTLSQAEAKQKCKSDLKDEGAKEFAEEFEANEGESALESCERKKREDDQASNALGETSLAPLVSGLGIAGGLGIAVALFYCCLWAMRTGLLSRFWGSLGMALGIAALLGLILFTLIWFIYFGVLILDRVPNGRPPAWEAGEAVPWPTPGEQAAAELEGSGGAEPEDAEGAPEKRKRKQRE
jgi:hypothetical protein